jgi:hypothetical protein
MIGYLEGRATRQGLQIYIWIYGPRWGWFLRTCDVREKPIRRRRGFQDYDIAEDVFELTCEQVRYGIIAEWSDLRERWRA